MTEELHKLVGAALLDPGGDAPVEALARRGRARRLRRRAVFTVVPVLALVAGLLTVPGLVGQRVELAPAEQGGDGAGWPVKVRFEQVDVNYFELAQLPEMLASVELQIDEFAGASWQQWTDVGVASYRVNEALIGAPDGSPRSGVGERIAPEASAQVTHFDGDGGRSGSLGPHDHVRAEPDVAFATLAAARQVEPEWTPEEADGPRGVGPFFAPGDFFTGPGNREADLAHLPWPGFAAPDVDAKQLLREQTATALGLDAGDLSVTNVDVPYCVADPGVEGQDCAGHPDVEWVRYTFVRHAPTRIPLFRHWAGPDVDHNADALQVTQLRVTHIDLAADEPGGDPLPDATDAQAPEPEEATGAPSPPDDEGSMRADGLVGAQWRGPEGNLVSSRVINVIRGPEHCGWQSSVWMHVGWPLGTQADTAADIRQYVRDPQNVLPDTGTRASLDTGVQVPPDAAPTGYETDGVLLWLGADDGDDAIYIVFDDHAERWPRTAQVIACA